MKTDDSTNEILTPLRDDLQLLPGPRLEGGSPTWTLHDPVRNQFFRIGKREFEMLARWSKVNEPPVTAEDIVSSVNQKTSIEIEAYEVQELHQFFCMNFLLAPGYPASGNMIRNRQTQKTNFLLMVIHNYLFFRIPLIRPEAFLDATLPFAKLVCSRPFKYMMIICSVLGLFMISRQWQSFLHTFAYFFSAQGIFYYAMALTLVKIFHELGHAYTAKYYGVRVPTIGVAFIVLWPMLYSDTTESWKLTDRKARMQIVASGIQVELGLALLATLLWSFSPEGLFRSICFIIATATWITSLFLNLSPFMRFDGYYLLSDLLDTPNLQARAFNLGKWYLRDLLLGLKAPCPEIMSQKKIRLLIAYAFCTWLYRLVIFTTIALMVYHMFFKVLGLILFMVEITWFIFLPVLKELNSWWLCRDQVGFCNRNLMASFTLLCIFSGLFFLPWDSKVRTTALILPMERQVIYPPFSAQMEKIHVREGDYVKKGEPLFTLSDPQLNMLIKLSSAKIATQETILKRQIADSGLLEPRQIILSRIAEEMTQLAGYKKQINRLSITSPISGTIVDLEEIKQGQWINENQALGRVINQKKSIISGYIREEMLGSVFQGGSGLFYADNRDDPPIKGKIKEIEPVSQKILSEPYLASIYGGSLPVTKTADQRLLSHGSLYRLSMDFPAPNNLPKQVIRGNLILYGKPVSFFERFKKRLMAVIIRESGF